MSEEKGRKLAGSLFFWEEKKKAFVCACDRDTACNYLYAVIVCRLWNKWGNTVHAIFYTRLLIQDCGYSRRVLPTTLLHKVTDWLTENVPVTLLNKLQQFV